MGSSLAWFVVESAELADIATALDVKVKGRRGARSEFPLAARRLADGRWLVVSGNCDEPLFKAKQLGPISRLGQAFSGMMEEHVMASSFAAWASGRKTLSILHQCDIGSLHLKTTGRLPAEVAARKNAELEKQKAAGEDSGEDLLFELPIDMARQIARLDPYEELEGEFEELHIGFWRVFWRRALWWRMLIVFIAGGMIFILGLGQLARLLRWILAQLGLR